MALIPFRPDTSWIHEQRPVPLAIAHRGASAYAFDNTLRAFQLAHDLGADMWEVDVRLTADGVPVACHDADLKEVCGHAILLSDVTASQALALSAEAGHPIPLFSDVAALAKRLGTGIYLDAKEGEAATRAFEILLDIEVERVIVGANSIDYCRQLKAAGCAYPVSLLIGIGQDGFDLVEKAGADIIHPCWEHAGDRPDSLLDHAYFAAAKLRNLPVLTWHEERPDVLSALVDMPVLGICSDTPERVWQYRSAAGLAPEIVCHRGACKIAPENTEPAALAAWMAGFDYVEIDVRETADGGYAVHHDATLDRTTNAAGELKASTGEALAKLDAGARFDPFFTGTPIPSLDNILELAAKFGKKLYVEIKDGDPVRITQQVLQRLPADDAFFWSFDQDALHKIRLHSRDAKLMARPEDFQSLEACLSAFDADILEFNPANASAENIETVRRAGKKAMIAYMGEDPDVMASLLDLQPDLLNVNEPFLVHALLKTRTQQTQ